MTTAATLVRRVQPKIFIKRWMMMSSVPVSWAFQLMSSARFLGRLVGSGTSQLQNLRQLKMKSNNYDPGVAPRCKSFCINSRKFLYLLFIVKLRQAAFDIFPFIEVFGNTVLYWAPLFFAMHGLVTLLVSKDS